MNEQQLRETIVSALTVTAPEIDGIELDPDANFRDQIDIESVDYLQFVLALEQSLGVQIPDVDYPKLSSLNGAVAYLQARLA